MSCNWQNKKSWPLNKEAIFVYRLSLKSAGRFDLLSAEQQTKARAFQFEHHRQTYVAAHSGLRAILSSLIEVAPEKIELAAGEKGKPYLVDNPHGLEFNLSHAGEWAVVAVTLGQALGVDVEQLSERGSLDIARRFFHPHEIAQLEALPTAEQQAAFFHIWVQKEAYVKYLGTGITSGLDKFEVSVTGAGWIDQAVQMHCFELDQHHPAALCYSTSVNRIETIDWSH